MTAVRSYLLLALGLVFAVLVFLMVTAPVQETVDRWTPATASDPVTYQGDPNG